MHFFSLWLCFGVLASLVTSQSTQGLVNLLKRRIPNHVDDFIFAIGANQSKSSSIISTPLDKYEITSAGGKIYIEGNSISALASGLHRYFTDVADVDMWWFIGSQLHNAPSPLPTFATPLKGSSIVPWRNHFNTVTFSYTAAFWDWPKWELELDWLALRGVNLPLAWVGYEHIALSVFRSLNLTDAEILPYFSGPAFQSWNRFGNIQGDWITGGLPLEWIEYQFQLQNNITRRMVELGMTPILPAFTGFVPRALAKHFPDAEVINGSQWAGMPVEYTNVSFLQPQDPLFTTIQKKFIELQNEAYGNITHIYTLDQYNENNPASGDQDYLQNVSSNTWKSLKAADPDAVWFMQGWLFYALSAFWTQDRIQAYLSGVPNNEDLMIIDLFSENQPQWQKTNSYYGKPWIWCQLHDFGGVQGLYGQIENLTINPIEALAASPSMVGMGNCMEGQEGNEIVYDLLLDQAWSTSPVNTESYFHDWVARRYSGTGVVPEESYVAWEILRKTVYNNTNSNISSTVQSFFEAPPNITGMVHLGIPTSTVIPYDPQDLEKAWILLYNASQVNSGLWENEVYLYEIVDITRQVLSNRLASVVYPALSEAYLTSSNISQPSTQFLGILDTIDTLLSAHPAFSLSTYISDARSATANATLQDSYERELKNQITLWGPIGEISDYAGKSWGGLVDGYYKPRWEILIAYLGEVSVRSYNETEVKGRLRMFEKSWQTTAAVRKAKEGEIGLQAHIDGIVDSWK